MFLSKYFPQMQSLWRLLSICLLAFLAGCGSLDGMGIGGDGEGVSYSAIAMPDRYAVDVAEKIYEQGGNAVDAAVATGFSLAVTFPEAGNIGGGGFMTIHMDGQSYFLDYREVAPKAASKNMYLDEDGNVIRMKSLIGGLAVGVPGTVWGLWEAHQKFGTLSWAEVVAPSIELARDGFIVHEELAGDKESAVRRFGDKTNFEEHFGRIEEGRVFKQPDLAQTLERVAALGPKGFYEGIVADQFITQMEKSGGIVTHEDLVSYRPKWREPLQFQWKDFTVVSAPPPSSGGIALAQLLKMKALLTDKFEGVEHNSSQYIHLTAEIEKRVFADRAVYLGDPDFAPVRVAELIDDAYIAKRAAGVQEDQITRGGNVPPGLESHDTTHYSLMDRYGNAVSNTYTLNWGFGSGVVVDGAGFLLNNEMDDFSAKPGVPNAFGVIGGTMNAIEPGKRMLSSMSPTILLSDNAPVAVLGTPGGSTIFTSIYQVLVNDLEYDMSLQEAVSAPRFHHQLPAELNIRFDFTWPETSTLLEELEAKGYEVSKNSWGNFGDVQAISVIDGGKPEVGSDPRGRGKAKVIKHGGSIFSLPW